MKLTKQEQETYEQCLGHCHQCLLNGECMLQEKLKAESEEENENKKRTGEILG